MKAKIEIKMDNAAFDENGGTELARILKGVAERVNHKPSSSLNDLTLRDVNGNIVGKAEFWD